MWLMQCVAARYRMLNKEGTCFLGKMFWDGDSIACLFSDANNGPERQMGCFGGRKANEGGRAAPDPKGAGSQNMCPVTLLLEQRRHFHSVSRRERSWVWMRGAWGARWREVRA